MAAQSIPQPGLEKGQPRKVCEVPSEAGTLVIELLIWGLNMPHSAAWVPLHSMDKDYVDRYSGNESGAWLISEQKGGLWVLYQAALYPLQNLPQDVEQLGDGGYFDLLYSPWIGRIFLSYSKQRSRKLSTVSVLSFRLRYKAQQFSASDVREVFQAQPPLKQPLGYGGSLAATQEFLYIGLGSGGKPRQNVLRHWGSVNKIPLRPKQSAQRKLFSDSITRLPNLMVSIGHGEIYDLFWNPARRQLWSVEQLRKSDGTVLADELNLLGEGRNYGWGEAAKSESPLGRAQGPVLSWVRDRNWSTGWSSVLAVPPSGSLFHAWADDLILSALEGQSLYRMALHPDPTQESGLQLKLREQLLNAQVGPIRWLGLGPDGAIYLLAYHGGRLLRLRPKRLKRLKSPMKG